MTWWHYLLLSNLYLILFFGFYVLLLQRETFFQLNRMYLVGSAVMSFLIPVIQLDAVKQWFITQKVHQTIYSANPGVIYRFNHIEPDQFTMGELLFTIYLTGIFVLSVKLIWQLFTLSRIIQNKQVAAAWSFFKNIKVDDRLENRDVIFAHEQVHARQWHSVDVLLVEVIMILNWFNPVVYLYRRSVKHIHEFIADRDALKAGVNTADYALLLLSQTFNAPVHHLLNPFFSGSVLKQRIIMLQKNRSNYAALVKYGFSAPLFALMLALSSATLNNSTVVKNFHKEAEEIFSAHAPAISDAVVGSKHGFQGHKEALVRFPAVVIVNHNRLSVSGAAAINNATVAAKQDSMPQIVSQPREIFKSVEKLPEFPGGISSFSKFLQKNLTYPAEAQQNGIQGRVNVTFVIGANGALSNIKAISGPQYGLQDEAVRVLAMSPKWVPGEQNGRKVAVQYTVPVLFTLEGTVNKDSSSTHSALGSVRRVTALTIHSQIDSSYSELAGKKPININLSATGSLPGKKPLVIVDGKAKSSDFSLASLNPDNIASISVYKRDEAFKDYRNANGKGIIVITMKK